MRKEYVKPSICNHNNLAGIVPLAAVASAAAATKLAPAAALVGGYAVGRAVKQAMEIRIEDKRRSLVEVIV